MFLICISGIPFLKKNKSDLSFWGNLQSLFLVKQIFYYKVRVKLSNNGEISDQHYKYRTPLLIPQSLKSV